jgi:hypothetical protein
VTATTFNGAALPVPDPEPLHSVARRPRNYLVAVERRRLFWAFMPPALMVVVLLELFVRPLWEPPRPPREREVDTRMEAVAGPPPADDAVVITPAEQKLETDDPTLLGASPESLSRIRDATFFGSNDQEAWLDMFLTLQGERGQRIPKPQDVGFTEIFTQPRSFRGRAVRMRGTLRRLEKLDGHADEYGVPHYWQGWLEPAGGPASPVVIHFLRIPEGMAAGLEIMEPVVVSGFFLKNMAYRAADGVRIAPLVLSLEPGRPLLASADAQSGGFWERSIGLIGVGTMLGIVSLIGIGYLLVGLGRRRRLETDSLDPETFTGTPFSISESLRNLASTDADGDGGQTGGAISE